MTTDQIIALAFVIIFALVVLVALVWAVVLLLSEAFQKKKFYKNLDSRPEMRKLWDELWLADKEWALANADVENVRNEIDEKCDFNYTKYLTAEDAASNEVDLEELRVMLKNYESIENGAQFKYNIAKEEFIYYCDEKGIKIPDSIDFI